MHFLFISSYVYIFFQASTNIIHVIVIKLSCIMLSDVKKGYQFWQGSFHLFSFFVILTSSGLGLHQETNILDSLGKLFCSRFCVQSTYVAQEYLTCTYTAISGYQITPWSSGSWDIHFLCPEKFMLGQCRIRTTDLSIFSRTCYHWTNAPLCHFCLLMVEGLKSRNI